MLNFIIRKALIHRGVVLVISILIVIWGLLTLASIPIDVFPNLTKPTITVLTEGHGRSPEEVETLITMPLEQILNGLPGLDRVRSTSGIGLSVVYLEFSWNSDIYRSRQLVAEKLQLAKERLPKDTQPIMGPVASIMGQIQQIAVSSDGSVSPIDLRTLAEWTIRPRLLAIPGIAQVISIGGGLKQYQILISADKINSRQLTLEQIDSALSNISQNTSGGFLDKGSQELLVRNIGAVTSLEDINKTVVGLHFGRPVFVEDIATVKEGARTKRGDGSYQANPAVIMTIQKQPDADTLKITNEVDQVIQEMKVSLPKGVVINTDVFKQANFIQAAISSIKSKLGFGTILVLAVLLLFLANLRMSLVTLTAIPLSFLISFIVFKLFGLSVNTMTLGGLAVAIGELVDDSIVDVENIFRRLGENQKLTKPKSSLLVIFEASSEVRNSIVLSTIIIALVFLPLFSLTGLEGQLFTPLAISYLTALMASLLISLTLTPVLSYYLLRSKINKHKDTLLTLKLKSWDLKILNQVLDKPRPVMIVTGLLFGLALAVTPFMGRDFLPQFNEGTAMVSVFLPPGVSLSESNLVGNLAEKKIMEVPEVKSVSRRTGRAELDEHAMSVNVSEIDVDLKKHSERSREQILNDIRSRVESIPRASSNVGQPLSHLMDHTLSGVSAQIAIKIFGPDLSELQKKASEIQSSISGTKGIVDLRVEQQGMIPQLKIHIMREEAAKYGLSAGELTDLLESAFNGHIAGQVLEEQKFFDLFYRFDDTSRNSIETINQTVIKTMPNGNKIKVSDVADIYETKGPNEIGRENGQRRIAISANASGRDLGSLVEEIKAKISSQIQLSSDYLVTYGGQFQAQETASKKILIFGLLALFGIASILYLHFKSKMIVAQIMLTIPFAFIGGILLLFITDRTITVASLVGFVTLCGVASRNGIMMISHYLHLMKFEGENFTKEMVIRGSLERLVPVLMTASVTSIGLLPLVFGKGQAGSEILHPVAIVIVGGLISSSLLDIIVTPTIFYNFAKKSAQKYLSHNSSTEGELQ